MYTCNILISESTGIAISYKCFLFREVREVKGTKVDTKQTHPGMFLSLSIHRKKNQSHI